MAGDDHGRGEGERDGLLSFRYTEGTILGDPGAVSWDDRMFVVKVYCKIETSPWALTLTGPLPEAFEFPVANQQREAGGKLSCFLTRRSFPH